MSQHTLEMRVALGLLMASLVLLICSGFSEWGIFGLTLSVCGFLDFFFTHRSLKGQVACEVYGDPGEELWRFRSFILLAGGPFVALYEVLFN